jgi:hypothetical protein
VNWLVSSQLEDCELLLLGVGSRGTGIVREPAARSRYKAAASDDVTVDCSLCDSDL